MSRRFARDRGYAVSRFLWVVCIVFTASACALSAPRTVECAAPLVADECDTAADIALDSLDADTQVAVTAVRVERTSVRGACMEGRPMYDVTFDGDGFDPFVATVALTGNSELVACRF